MKVLLVEDESEVAAFIARGLTSEGWSVTVARDGEAALKLLKSQSFDVMLLDFILPGMNGLSVVTMLQERGNTTPIIVLSALSDDDDRMLALKARGVDSIRKPFDFEDLIFRLSALSDH